MDVTKFDKWTRQLVQIDNCSTPEVMSNNTIFRFMLARNEEIAANSWHDIWAIDNFQALVGEHRIGWETGDLVKRDDSLFCYQEPRQLTPYKYDYVEDEDGGIAFLVMERVEVPYELIHLFKLLCRLALRLLKMMNVLITTSLYRQKNTTHLVGIVSQTHSNLFGVATERSLLPHTVPLQLNVLILKAIRYV